jgi:hypothetical protein
MANQQNHQDPKAPMKGGGSTQAGQKGQKSKPVNKGDDQWQQTRTDDTGGDYNTGGSNDSGPKDHQ